MFEAASLHQKMVSSRTIEKAVALRISHTSPSALPVASGNPVETKTMSQESDEKELKKITQKIKQV